MGAAPPPNVKRLEDGAEVDVVPPNETPEVEEGGAIEAVDA